MRWTIGLKKRTQTWRVNMGTWFCFSGENVDVSRCSKDKVMGSALARVERQYFYTDIQIRDFLRFFKSRRTTSVVISQLHQFPEVTSRWWSCCHELDPSAGRANSKRQGLFGSDNSFRPFTGSLAKPDLTFGCGPLALGLTRLSYLIGLELIPSIGFPNW